MPMARVVVLLLFFERVSSGGRLGCRSEKAGIVLTICSKGIKACVLPSFNVILKRAGCALLAKQKAPVHLSSLEVWSNPSIEIRLIHLYV